MARDKLTTPWAAENEPSPLFSVVWFGRDRVQSARAAIASVQAQACSDLELVVEDCGSTDGTLELFRAFAASDRRGRIQSRSRTCAGDAALSALRRCRGRYIVICPQEGLLLPDALEAAAGEFARQPTAGGLWSKGFLVDCEGQPADRVDIVTLLFGCHRPFLPAGIFRRGALMTVGLERDDWCLGAFALDLCYRLACDWGFVPMVQKIVDCAQPQRQFDGLAFDVDAVIEDRLRFVSRTFSSGGFLHGVRDALALTLECKVNQLGLLWQDCRNLGRADDESHVVGALNGLASALGDALRRDHRTLRNFNRLFGQRSANLGALSVPIRRALAVSSRLGGRAPIHAGYAIWNSPLWNPQLTARLIMGGPPASRFHDEGPSREAMHADLYAMAGHRFEGRGQLDLALAMWDYARPPDDVDIDSIACQTLLKSPSVTEANLAARQRDWVRRHIGRRPAVTLPASPAREKIRVAYHCEFMQTNTMRAMMGHVISAHDRSKFEIIGYSPHVVSEDFRALFDTWRHTPRPHPDEKAKRVFDDAQFAALVRADDIDVFVELSGFSPGHRFGAMSLRCAPVQVSHLNHTGTSQVPNVDYVLADDICIPPRSDAERHYSEQIYRLGSCFFCFDYTASDEPPVAPSPHLRNGYVTFGCSGSGGKIGMQLIEVWARLLHRVPTARLQIQNVQLSSSENRRFMAERFAIFGISTDRLSLLGGVDRETLLRTYADIDISLDTWPYCGGNTIAESMWHGVPVVTRLGNRFSSAYGASLVAAGGCADLIARSFDEYVEIAAGLAADSARLVRLRADLRSMSVEYGLGDSRRMAWELERAYRDMLARARASLEGSSATTQKSTGRRTPTMLESANVR